MRTFASFALAAAGASAMTTSLQNQFMFWAQKHGKDYKDMEEFMQRFTNWTKTHFEIERINSSPNQTQTLGHNKFSDLTQDEYKTMLNYKPKADANREHTLLDASDLPESINWVELGGVNSVQDQGSCGSCWAFSAIAAMEGQHFAQTGELLKLSEQQCVDCDTDSYGCGGGWQDNCFYYVQDNGGISLEEDYPYEAGTNECWAEYWGPVSVSQIYHVQAKSDEQLMAAIAQGVTSVTVDAESTYFRNYSSGVVTSAECGTKLDHAIAAVGYGTTDDGIDYYLVRNSWGAAWGDNGYIKIGRGGSDEWGVCGILEISDWAQTN